MFASEAAESARWYEIGWVDWLNVVGVILALIGLYLTWRQARDAKRRAGEAKTISQVAAESLERTRRQLLGNQLLLLIPQLRWIANSLDEAILSGDALTARKLLDDWRRSAGHVRGVLPNESAPERQLHSDLQASLALAFRAGTTLFEGKKPVVDACRKARESIGSLCDELTMWSGEVSTRVEERQT